MEKNVTIVDEIENVYYLNYYNFVFTLSKKDIFKVNLKNGLYYNGLNVYFRDMKLLKKAKILILKCCIKHEAGRLKELQKTIIKANKVIQKYRQQLNKIKGKK